MTRRLRCDDRGSVLPLIIGAVVVMTMLVTVVTDVSVLWLARRSVQAAVDGAALAGAQAVDLRTLYAHGADGDLALDPRAARSAVRRYVRALPSAQLPSGFGVASVTATSTTVSVRAEATVQPRSCRSSPVAESPSPPRPPPATPPSD